VLQFFLLLLCVLCAYKCVILIMRTLCWGVRVIFSRVQVFVLCVQAAHHQARPFTTKARVLAPRHGSARQVYGRIFYEMHASTTHTHSTQTHSHTAKLIHTHTHTYIYTHRHTHTRLYTLAHTHEPVPIQLSVGYRHEALGVHHSPT
jgi:hypothetical protein